MGQLFDLWSQWLSGDQLGGTRLWGWPVLAWGRLGKVLQFTAGLTVMLDLVGPDRLRAFGGRLLEEPWRKLTGRAKLWALGFGAVWALAFELLLLLQATVPGFLSDLGIPDTWIASTPAVIVMLLAVLAIGFLSTSPLRRIIRTILIPQSRKVIDAISTKDGRTRVYSRLRDVENPPDPYVSTQFVIALWYVLVLIIPALLWMVIAHGIVLPATRGLAVLLYRSQPAHPLRWVAFGLFLIGFHFDLLAS